MYGIVAWAYPTVPQVLVVRRSLDVGDQTVFTGRPQVIAGVVGAEQIMRWAAGGAPLRLLGDVTDASGSDLSRTQ